MKKSLIVMAVALMGVGVMIAENGKGIVSTVFQTDIHCHGCSTKIMDNVPALGRGIKDVSIDMSTKEVTVTYDAKKNNAEGIIKGFKSIAVNATEKK